MKRLILFAFSIFAINSSFAQFFIPIVVPSVNQQRKSYGVSSNSMSWDDSYSNSMVPWIDHKLTWDDFKGTVETGSGRIFDMKFYNRPYIKKEKIGNIKYVYNTNLSFTNSATSWVVDSCKNYSTLKLAQTGFNLWELYSRKALIEYNNVPGASINEIYDFYNKVFDKRVKELEDETDFGRNRQKLDEYSEQINQELENTTFNPEDVTTSLKEQKGYYFGLGFLSHIPFTDYITPLYGFDLVAGGFVKRHFIAGDLNFSFGGKCQKPIVTDKGTIHKDDKMFCGSLLLNYGYNVYSGKTVELTPFIGCGVNFYDGGKKDPMYQSKKGNDSVEKAGFSFGVGFNMDFVLSREIAIKVVDEDISRSSNNITVRPYFNLTHYSGELGWVPALNIALMFNMKTVKLK